jgi:uncharacterized protein with GYD domain
VREILAGGSTAKEITMATYVLLTKLSSHGLAHPHRRGQIGRKWFSAVKKKCPEVQWLDHYALLGPYDFMDIYEAPDTEAAAKVSMITMSQGAVQAETWAALPYKNFVRLAATL